MDEGSNPNVRQNKTFSLLILHVQQIHPQYKSEYINTYVERKVIHVEERHLGVILPANEHIRVCPNVSTVKEPCQAQAYKARAPAQGDVCPGLAPDDTFSINFEEYFTLLNMLPPVMALNSAKASRNWK